MEKSNLGLQKQSSKAFVFYKGMRYALVCACTAHARAPKRNWARRRRRGAPCADAACALPSLSKWQRTMWPTTTCAEGLASATSTGAGLGPFAGPPAGHGRDRTGARGGGGSLAGGGGGGAGEGGSNVSKDVEAQAGALHRATNRDSCYNPPSVCRSSAAAVNAQLLSYSRARVRSYYTAHPLICAAAFLLARPGALRCPHTAGLPVRASTRCGEGCVGFAQQIKTRMARAQWIFCFRYFFNL